MQSYWLLVGLGGQTVIVFDIGLRFAGSNPAEDNGF
jgi:hypothetical protein